jgi:hypothetical protein
VVDRRGPRGHRSGACRCDRALAPPFAGNGVVRLPVREQPSMAVAMQGLVAATSAGDCQAVNSNAKAPADVSAGVSLVVVGRRGLPGGENGSHDGERAIPAAIAIRGRFTSVRRPGGTASFCES